jgi:hypothetical protein
VSKAKWPTPKTPGFHWAKWRIADESSKTPEYESYLPCDRWEVVDVFENFADTSSQDYLRVHIPGVVHSQSLGNFIWGPGPIAPPAKDATR